MMKKGARTVTAKKWSSCSRVASSIEPACADGGIVDQDGERLPSEARLQAGEQYIEVAVDTQFGTDRKRLPAR